MTLWARAVCLTRNPGCLWHNILCVTICTCQYVIEKMERRKGKKKLWVKIRMLAFCELSSELRSTEDAI